MVMPIVDTAYSYTLYAKNRYFLILPHVRSTVSVFFEGISALISGKNNPLFHTYLRLHTSSPPQ